MNEVKRASENRQKLRQPIIGSYKVLPKQMNREIKQRERGRNAADDFALI